MAGTGKGIIIHMDVGPLFRELDREARGSHGWLLRSIKRGGWGGGGGGVRKKKKKSNVAMHCGKRKKNSFITKKIIPCVTDEEHDCVSPKRKRKAY